MSMPQSDLVLIKAISEGISYLRKNAWQLDYVWQDVMAANLATEFGREEIARAKRWFLKTEIPVFSTYRFDKPIFPCVTVSVVNSTESIGKASMGEVDPQVWPEDEEICKTDLVQTPDMVSGPFSPGYNINTGLVTLPNGFSTELIFVNQGIHSQTSGETYKILSIDSDTSFTIETGIRDNFTDSFIAPAYNMLKIVRGLANFDEQYEINCCIQGTPGEMFWLHSVITYILLQRRQYLTEKFNIGLSNISSGELYQDTDPNATENFFVRKINMTGYVEVRWVNSLSEFLEGISSEINLVKNDDPIIYSKIKT